jgi:hypothetical protein
MVRRNNGLVKRDDGLPRSNSGLSRKGKDQPIKDEGCPGRS